MNGLKDFLQRKFPRPYGALQTARYKYALQHAFAQLTADHGLVVQGGPFKGMKYVPQIATPARLIGDALLPKLVGCYEAELHGTLATLPQAKYTRIVNIGCAEGYYAVGLALRDPGVVVFAFDTLPRERQFCAEMATANGVADQVRIGAECTVEALNSLASDQTLIICDCEGCELALLDPVRAPGLSRSDVLVELHDCVNPTISKRVPERFAATHEITHIQRSPRDLGTYGALSTMTPYRQRLSASEFRWGPISWAFMRSKVRA